MYLADKGAGLNILLWLKLIKTVKIKHEMQRYIYNKIIVIYSNRVFNIDKKL